MKFVQRKKIIRILSSVLLLGIIVSFIHSELNHIEIEEHRHNDHDYCKLVDDTAIRITKYSNQSLIDQHLIDGLSTSGILPDNSKPGFFSNNFNYDTKTYKYSNDIYIFTQTFLI